MRPLGPLPEPTRGRTTNPRGKTARAKSSSCTPGTSTSPGTSGVHGRLLRGLSSLWLVLPAREALLIAIPETFSILRGGDFSLFSPSTNSIGPRDVRAVAASMVIRRTLAPRYTHHEGWRNICSQARLLAYSPRLCGASGVHPPRGSQGTACPSWGPRCPRHPRGNTRTLPPRARRVRHGGPGRACISRD
jgi:hypothetical protein